MGEQGERGAQVSARHWRSPGAGSEDRSRQQWQSWHWDALEHPQQCTPLLPTGWVRGVTRHGQGEMCHARDMLAGDGLAHLLCRSLMMRLSSPSPAMAVPRGLQRQGQR